jgi:DNA-binding transcriptional LysR family regulator
MNLRNLQIFLAVAEEMNITKAAEKLFISQPAVSKAIKNLEEELTVRVFVRDKHKGLQLTDIGREIAILGRQLTNIEQKIHDIADQENNLMRGKIKIGCFPAVSKNTLPKIFAEYRQRFPHVNIELYEGTSDQVKEWVSERVIDIGIVASPFAEYDSITLRRDYMVAIVPSNHKWEFQNQIKLSEHQNEFIFCKGGHEISMLNVIEDEGIDFKENLTVQTAETLISMIDNGLGIGIVSDFTLSSVTHDLTVKKVSPSIERDIGLIALDFKEATPAVKAFVQLLTKRGGD